MIDLGKLEELAGKATPGPWILQMMSHGGDAIHASGVRLFRALRLSDGTDIANAAYIASLDPQTVMALIAVVKVAQDVARFDQYSLSNANHIAVHAQAIGALREALSAFQEHP